MSVSSSGCGVTMKEIMLGIPKYAPLCGTHTAKKYYKGKYLESNLISRQRVVFEAMKSGYSVFLTGFYDSGKNYLCQVFMEWCKRKSNSINIVRQKSDIDLTKRNVLVFLDKEKITLKEIEALADFKKVCGAKGQIVVFAKSGCFWKTPLSARLNKLFPAQNQYRWRRSMVVDSRLSRPYFTSLSRASGYSDDEFWEEEHSGGSRSRSRSTNSRSSKEQECSDYDSD